MFQNKPIAASILLQPRLAICKAEIATSGKEKNNNQEKSRISEKILYIGQRRRSSRSKPATNPNQRSIKKRRTPKKTKTRDLRTERTLAVGRTVADSYQPLGAEARLGIRGRIGDLGSTESASRERLEQQFPDSETTNQ